MQPCQQETVIALMKQEQNEMKKVLEAAVLAINTLNVTLASMQASQKVGSWFFQIIAPMLGGGVVSLIVGVFIWVLTRKAGA